jgi:hypothetical protein
LKQEVHLGPPGYGETPERDKRDTIVVLALDTSITVCGDESLGPKEPRQYRVQRVQLIGNAGTATTHVGASVLVFGGLSRATWGWQFTDVVLGVDSIPELMEGRAARRLTSGWSRRRRFLRVELRL